MSLVATNRFLRAVLAGSFTVAITGFVSYPVNAEDGLTEQQIKFIGRLVNQESGGNQRDRTGAIVVSSAGARGLFQLMPTTAAALHVNPDSVEGNVRGGLTEVVRLWNKYHGNPRYVAAAYNCGEQCTDDWLAGRRILPTETLHYIDAVANDSAQQQTTAVESRPAITPSPQYNVDAWAASDREERDAETPTAPTPTITQPAEPIPEARPAVLQSLEITSNQE